MSEFTTHVHPAAQSADDAVNAAPLRSLLTTRQPRVWPGVIVIALMWLAILLPGWIVPGTMPQFMGMLWGPMVGMACIVLWWLAASRVRWTDRLLIVAACAALGTGAYFLYDSSVGGFGLILHVLPVVATAWVLWLLATPFLSWPARRIGLLLTFVLAWGYFALVRTDGIDGSFRTAISWRWSPTAEDKYLLYLKDRKQAVPLEAKPQEDNKGDWVQFRGPDRDGKLTGVRIASDWDQHPPKELWRQPVGPGWGSFAVVGDLLYTQEQRGPLEAVVCYNANTGAEVWAHTDATRFTEVVAGPGPRATPTYQDGKIYAFGANGILNCLDAATGEAKWTKNVREDADAKVPMWGFSSSPLVTQGIVSVFAAGANGKSVLAYHADDGKLAWSAAEGVFGYSSPQLAHLGGVEQILIATETGLTSIEPVEGKVLWQHSWPVENNNRVVQPAILSDTDVLLGTGMGAGTRRIHVTHKGDSWETEAVWTTKAIKPYYNDFVVYQNHLYGFDGPFFMCLDLDDSKEPKWRERGYGNGQVLLLAEQGLLLILSEKGEVALVEAAPYSLKEVSRFQAIKGKTWNHPVVAHGKLFVRNGEEMACFQLTEAGK